MLQPYGENGDKNDLRMKSCESKNIPVPLPAHSGDKHRPHNPATSLHLDILGYESVFRLSVLQTHALAVSISKRSQHEGTHAFERVDVAVSRQVAARIAPIDSLRIWSLAVRARPNVAVTGASLEKPAVRPPIPGSSWATHHALAELVLQAGAEVLAEPQANAVASSLYGTLRT
jgi:hypothetical protein